MYMYKHLKTHRKLEEEQEPETEREKKPETVVVQLEVDKIGFYGDVTRRSMTDLGFYIPRFKSFRFPSTHPSSPSSICSFRPTEGAYTTEGDKK